MSEFVIVAALPMLLGVLGACAFGFAMGALLATWIGHTDRSRQEVAILRDVIRAFGWQDKEFAAATGYTPHQLSRIWAGKEALNAHRLADLPEAFRAMWDAARVASRGGRVYEQAELEFVRGLASLPKPDMLRLTMPVPLERKQA